MVHVDKPSLSVCALGAGAAHAAVLALVLPVMITLPAPKDEAQGTVAIQVLVRSVPPAPFIGAAMSIPDAKAALEGEGDVDEGVWTATEADEITGALPDVQEQVAADAPAPLMDQAALSEPVAAAPPAEAVAIAPPEAAFVEDTPTPALEEDVELTTVASTEAGLPDEPDFMPDVVPRPYRKPSFKAIEEKPQVVEEKAQPKPVPHQRITRSRPRPAAKPFKGILGGTQATPMEEFPFRAGR